jgi:hypothetical protein
LVLIIVPLLVGPGRAGGVEGTA